MDIAHLFLFMLMAGYWGWCLRAMREKPAPRCDYTDAEHAIGRRVTGTIATVHMQMACIGSSEDGCGFIVQQHATIAIRGKPAVKITVQGETA
jgi:hypothetical protein